MKKLAIFLKNFQTLYQSQPIPQQAALDYSAWWLATAQCSKYNVELESEAEKIFIDMQTEIERYGVSPRYVNKREINALANAFNYEKKMFSGDIFPKTHKNILDNPLGEDLNYRQTLYDELVGNVIEKWYKSVSTPPDDIIHATCTGYLSPSPLQRILSSKDWENITVTHSYQMGCYGAIPPVRMAVGFLTSQMAMAKEKKQVDVLHTEYSSLHFQAINNAPGQIVSMTLFGDGFIKYSAFLETAQNPPSQALKVLAAYDKIVPGTLTEMSLVPGPYSFEMWLSKNVPLKIKESIHSFVTAICSQIDLKFDEIKDTLLFALHPGGPKIIEHIKEQLGLTENQIRFSKKILYEHGNMVSATVPYIWKEMIEDPSVPIGTKVISIAFGPGLTLAGLILEKA